MGLGCGEIAGGGMSGGIWVVRVFNTGDDGGGEGLLQASTAGLDKSPQPRGWTVGSAVFDFLQYFWVFKFFKTPFSMSCNLKERVSWAIGGYS